MALFSKVNRRAFRKTLFIGYLLLGHPEKNEFIEIVKGVDKAGLDVLELGLPSQNPYVDGCILRNAHKKVDTSVINDIDYLKLIRNNFSKPIWLMTYYNEFVGNNQYKKYVAHNLFDALVIPDIAEDERVKLKKEINEYNIDVLGFVNPRMSENEVHDIAREYSLIYTQLHAGITGTVPEKDDYKKILDILVKYEENINVAGFGISTTEKSIKLINQGFDGIIIGTEMVRRLNISKESLISFVSEIKTAIKE